MLGMWKGNWLSGTLEKKGFNMFLRDLLLLRRTLLHFCLLSGCSCLEEEREGEAGDTPTVSAAVISRSLSLLMRKTLIPVYVTSKSDLTTFVHSCGKL